MKKKTKKQKRIDTDEYFLKIASVIAERSTCRRHHTGAVAVRDKHILATGYNGAPSGQKDCLELGCLRDELNIPSGERHEICRAIHAEQNAIIQAAFHGVSIRNASLYCTNLPCSICAKMIINAGIKEIYYLSGYADAMSEEMFQEAGVKVVKLNNSSLDENMHKGEDS